MTDFYQNINPKFLKESRRADKDKSSREFLSIAKTSDTNIEMKKKRSKMDREWDEEVKKNWKMLNQYYLLELPVPHQYCSLPPKELAIRGVYADVVEEEMGPAMWLKGPGFPAKSGMLSVFQVTHRSISYVSFL